MKIIIFALSLITLLLLVSCSDSGEPEISNNPPNKPTAKEGVSYTCEVLRPTLKWGCDDWDGDDLTYTLKFGTSATFLTEYILSNVSLSTLEYTFTEELAPSTKYYWQIIVSDGKDETVGDVWDFSTIGDPKVNTVPSTPVIVSPKVNIAADNITFIWEAVVDDKEAENITYKLYVNDIETEVVGTTSKTLSVEAGECTWYVTAWDEDGNGSESERINITLN